MIKKTLIFSCLLAVPMTMSGCSNAKKQLGLEKKSPDEFAVVRRAPLEMPPAYALRPPQPGAHRPQEMATSEQARQVVFGEETLQQAEQEQPVYTASSSEGILLQQAGSDIVDPDIRRKVDSETRTLENRNKAVAQKLFGIGGDKERPSATVVDAAAEAERLKQNEQADKPVTEGETPTIEE